MKRIPRCFELAGQTIEVVLQDDLMEKRECYGCWLHDQMCIVLQTPGPKAKKELILQTFWHEALHAMVDILDEKMRHKLIDQLGHLIYQILKTSKF